MNYLIDTHVLLWAITEKDKLSDTVIEILENGRNNIFVSAISFWEVSLKYSIGKLNITGFLPDQLPGLATEIGFKLVSLSPAESATYHQFTATGHRDPFDGMLMWQAIQQNLILVSKDRSIGQYKSAGLKVIW
ncbi:type II toxin-antitoxin system VapC family toxin [Mucilaginibacter mali]|uniref:Type II toxin-antitoxin system VapC family toxin n=1 Tax=Mucilaginibacter mali TaxID=2740462 RepID=A0A7D4ULK8_9SPHI|nr:type II toxin-antitoxin system VapC family toxin [Mucilaginibacter mali]QKJ30081.1 type II toxin-antitoxin system VapC family toxin [Mucilaginibacter mali]